MKRLSLLGWPILMLILLSSVKPTKGTAMELNKSLSISAEEYRAELKDLHVLRSYAAKKNSFILGLEGLCNRPVYLTKGQRFTLLDTKGMGSLRHIWEYHGSAQAPFIFEFYVDGENSPSLYGYLDDIIAAARRADQRYVMNPGGVVDYDSHNLYLPVPFEESLRVDLVAIHDVGMVFMQLDYRLDDDSMQDVRLVQTGEGEKMQLAYEGPAISTNRVSHATTPVVNRSFKITGDGRVRIDEGPGIIRRLAFNAQRQGVRLRMFFDDAATPAVDVDLADFMGPFRGVAFNNNQTFLPMPYRRSVEIEISGSGTQEEWRIEADLEKVESFKDNWGFFHAKSNAPQTALGFQPVDLLITKGKGHWLGMSLYDSGHDHGGGDFAVIDGDTPTPGFLHGINGEDYFSFALFGKGENFPYSEAFSNEEGRLRLHLENPYPFESSIATSWGTLHDLKPRSVSFWYQHSPEDLSLSPQESEGLEWEVFGPVDAPKVDLWASEVDLDQAFAGLPSPQDLDAGKPVEVTHLMFSKVHQGVFDGWKKQHAVGAHLNLMYVFAHVLRLGGDHHMGYYPRAMMAQARLQTESERPVVLQISYDDPIEISLNGCSIFSDNQTHRGFVTQRIKTGLKQGENILSTKLLDTPSVNTCWAGLSLRILDQEGRDISGELQPKEKVSVRQENEPEKNTPVDFDSIY